MSSKLVSFTFMWVLIIITIILIIYAMSLEYKYAQIVTYPVPKCYNDWLCLQNINGEIVEINMSDLTLFSNSSVQKMCMPLTSDNIYNLTYVNQFGETVTENPSTYINTWSNISSCNASNNYAGCQLYQIGDIYWRSCYNGTVGSQFNNPTRTYFE